MPTQLNTFNNNFYKPGSPLKILLWHFTSLLVFNSGLFPFKFFKSSILRLFGASIGKKVVIKPYVNIKYPWFLKIGDYSWIGENVWIDNLAFVNIGENVVLSQGAYLLTGNHDYSKSTFDLKVNGIILEQGVWIGAKSVVCPGLICKDHSILTVGSVATKNMDAYGIYQGNPAIKVKDRVIQ